MQRIARHKLLILPITLLCLLCIAQSQAADFSKGVLWEVSGKSNPPSYLLGTIHSDDPAVTAIPAPVQMVMLKVQSFTAELDLDLGAMLEAQTQMMLPLDQDLKTIIGQQRYDKAVELMSQYGMPEMLVARMKPWAIAAQLMMPRPTTGVFLDLKLFQQAQGRGIPVYGLETVAEQMGVFEKLTKQQQIAMLDQSLREHKNMPAMIKRLTRLYIQRDLAGLQRISDEQMRNTERGLANAMEKNLINDRNVRMADRMEVRFKEGNALIAIGALHLPGNNGVLHLLQQRGYRLKAIY